jgi:5'-nucleotidase
MLSVRTCIPLLLSAALAGCGGGDDTSGNGHHDMASAGDDMAVGSGDDMAVGSGDDMATGTHSFVDVQVLAFNDFHGWLGPPTVFNGSALAPISDPATGTGADTDLGTKLVPAGGAAYLATHLANLRANHANSITVSAGDLTGASPLLSGNNQDEPAIFVMNQLGLAINAVGNHEFDNGVNELLRLQYGGCAQPRFGAVSCATDMGFGGANFEYLAANVEFRPGQTVLPSYVIKHFGSAAVAFVGMTLKDTSPYSKGGIKGLTFDDEVQTVNALVPSLKALGVSSIVVLVHQGDSPPPGTTYDACNDPNDANSPVAIMAKTMDPAVDAIVSAHTHRAYSCTINGKLVTSAASYGRVVTEINLHIDVDAKAVASKSAKQHIVTRDVTPSPAINAIINQYLALTRTTADVNDGYQSADISNYQDALTGQSPMGVVIADGMLASSGAQTYGATIALMNSGGVRDGMPLAKLYPTDTLTADGVITYEKIKTVQPFSNTLTVGALTPADLKEILEEQWKGQPYVKMLQISGFSYHYSQSAAVGSKVVSIRLAGASADLDLTDTTNRTIKAVVNNFLSDKGGGDGFVQFGKVPAFAPSTTPATIDADATAAYTQATFTMGAPLGVPPVTGRVLPDP